MDMMTGLPMGMPHEGKSNKRTNMDADVSLLLSSYMKSGRMFCLISI
jgi:hypothetical protein